MKYMGSKRAMLSNGLGEILENETSSADRFIDLFAGSGAVSIHVAQKFPIPVTAIDLQKYSAILTSAVIGRQRRFNWENIWEEWTAAATKLVDQIDIPNIAASNKANIQELREWCNNQQDFPITKAYGGHYFSPEQTVWIDALRINLPVKKSHHTAAHAALIQAASQSAAAPGHTAQPFQPTITALPFLQDAWKRDIVGRTKKAFSELASACAMRRGAVDVADANEYAKRIRENDLVFIDPPYSGVHYSRFYHVLETIAHGECGEVSGIGRYPETILRPRSRYSLKTESTKAIDELLRSISLRGAKAIFTFPNHECSNGLSGDQVLQIAQRHFTVKENLVASKFSTLGGTRVGNNNSKGRSARQDANELIMLLYPK